MAPAVVKLGGSLFRGDAGDAWLEALAGAGPVVVVVGGGEAADEVRAAQRAAGFDDAVAHEMAVMAMDQMADRHVALRAGPALVTSLEEIRAALDLGDLPVWLPSEMVLAAPDVPASWDVTSDSLAAWLAPQVGADRLVLVKALPDREAGAGDLARDGVVDKAFPEFLARAGVPAWWTGPDDPAGAAAALRAGGAPGSRIAP